MQIQEHQTGKKAMTKVNSINLKLPYNNIKGTEYKTLILLIIVQYIEIKYIGCTYYLMRLFYRFIKSF